MTPQSQISPSRRSCRRSIPVTSGPFRVAKEDCAEQAFGRSSRDLGGGKGGGQICGETKQDPRSVGHARIHCRLSSTSPVAKKEELLASCGRHGGDAAHVAAEPSNWAEPGQAASESCRAGYGRAGGIGSSRPGLLAAEMRKAGKAEAAAELGAGTASQSRVMPVKLIAITVAFTVAARDDLPVSGRQGKRKRTIWKRPGQIKRGVGSQGTEGLGARLKVGQGLFKPRAGHAATRKRLGTERSG